LGKCYYFGCNGCGEEFVVSHSRFIELEVSRIKYCITCGEFIQGDECPRCQDNVESIIFATIESIFNNHSNFIICPYCGSEITLSYIY
jgi:hypothetical protein